jgi:uncharacterized membrane protein HdeD (DUF308 family)
MTNATRTRGWSSGRVAAVAILTVVGILAIIAGILYLTEPAKSLPAVLGTITSPAVRANEHRSLRGEAALAFGVICLIAAGITGWQGRSAPR